MSVGRKNLNRTERLEMEVERDRHLWLCWQCVVEPATGRAQCFTGVLSFLGTRGTRSECTHRSLKFISQVAIVQVCCDLLHTDKTFFSSLSISAHAMHGPDLTTLWRRLQGTSQCLPLVNSSKLMVMLCAALHVDKEQHLLILNVIFFY